MKDVIIEKTRIWRFEYQTFNNYKYPIIPPLKQKNEKNFIKTDENTKIPFSRTDRMTIFLTAVTIKHIF